jgi:hypothetical protein
MFVIFFNEFLRTNKFIALHFGDPNGIQGNKEHILSPFLLDLCIDFCELFELQRFAEILEQREAFG